MTATGTAGAHTVGDAATDTGHGAQGASGASAYRAYASEDVVTGEGVAVELPVATVPTHLLSGLIDVAATFLLLALGALGASALVADVSEAVAGTTATVLAVGCLVVFPAALETATRGRSLGKLALGLRTVREDGGPITLRHALTRALVGVVEIWMLFGVPALVAALISPRGKRLGDLAAGTYVITQRAQLQLVPPPAMPPHLAGWAAGADIATLPTGLTVAVRQFLARAPSLAPASRELLGRQLLAATLDHVSPTPPPGSHPEYVLAAVIADRRRRDLARLARAEALRSRVLPPDSLGS